MASYNHKGNAAAIMASMDKDKKADLRRSHFDVGGRSYPYVTLNQSTYRPLTANQSKMATDR